MATLTQNISTEEVANLPSGQIAVVFTARWQIRESLVITKTLNWTILGNTLTVTTDLNWSIQEPLSVTFDLNWSIWNWLTVTPVLSWQIQEPFLFVSTLAWQILGKAAGAVRRTFTVSRR